MIYTEYGNNPDRIAGQGGSPLGRLLVSQFRGFGAWDQERQGCSSVAGR